QILTAAAPKLHAIASTVPPQLSDIIQSALEREADRRPTMQAFRDKLLAFVEGRGRPLPSLSSGSPATTDSEPPAGVADPTQLERIIELAQEDYDVSEGDRASLRGFPTMPAGTLLPDSGREERDGTGA